MNVKTEKHSAKDFASQLLAWYQHHGRKDLPWQQDITPYRVWISEIMLQQTQVNTVIPYFERFVARFAGVESLASASEDEVLHHWSGLGYYSRARNLHSAAKQLLEEHSAEFPDDLDALQSLPGIGRSTAGAIRATAFELPTPILDGNVKRVLARHDGIEGWPGKSATANALWDASTKYTPGHSARAYTQAVMDLGATLCTRSKPDCLRCPVNTTCVALQQDRIAELPGKKPKKTLPIRQTRMHIVVNKSGEVLLEKRPGVGVWGGLWSFPEESPLAGESDATEWPVLRHTFSHFHLDITPVLLRAELEDRIMDSQQRLWYNVSDPQELGLAAPVSKLLRQLENYSFEN